MTAPARAAHTGAATARHARRHNERAILAELRRAGAASKPEVARRIALSPQAVNGIFTNLLEAGLIKEGGRREGAVGHPSTLYAIRPDGAYAVGVEIGAHALEAALVDFTGQMVYRASTAYARPDPRTLRDAFAEGLANVLAHARTAGIEPDRIAGIGVAEPAFIAEPAAAGGALRDVVPLWRGLPLRQALPEVADLPIHLQRGAVVGALSLAMREESQLPRSYLYLAIGETVDACLVLDGIPYRGGQDRAGRFAALPAPGGGTVGAVAGFASLRARLAESGFSAWDTDDLYRALHERADIVADWGRAAAAAVAMGAQAVQACLDLDGLVLQVEPPNALGDRIARGLSESFAGLPALGLAVPAISRRQTRPGTLASAAAAIALHERFAPRLERLTRQGDLAAPPPPDTVR